MRTPFVPRLAAVVMATSALLAACNAENPNLQSPPAGDAGGSGAGGSVDAEPGPSCVPGRVETCPCPGGGDGTQVCGDDGVFGACDCGPGPSPDEGVAGAVVPADVGVDAQAPPDAGPEPDAELPADAGPTVDAAAPDAAEPDAALPPCADGDTREAACGLNGRGTQAQRCAGGTWTDEGPCEDPDSCVDGEPLPIPCGLNGRGEAPAACEAGHPGPAGACVDPDACVDGAQDAAACGLNGRGRLTSTCTEGQWQPDGPCDDPDTCVDDAVEREACGILGNGQRERTCAAGTWSEFGPCDDPDRACEDGDVEEVACGLNLRGVQSHVCVGMRWGDFGPCADPDVCVDGAMEAEACGLNDRGTRARTCVEGQWALDPRCDDPDACPDGAEESQACGQNRRGTQSRTCLDGQWSSFEPCRDPDVCVDGAEQQVPCGLNGRGTKSITCAGGQWGPPGACSDPDECLDGAAEVVPCGPLGDGEMGRTCVAGRWGVFGPCEGATPCPDPLNPGCPAPRPERCNGLDDDLDGQTDEGLDDGRPVAGPFEAALNPAIEAGLAWLRAREAGSGRFNSQQESTSSVGLGTLAFLERRGGDGVGAAAGYAGLVQADRDMIVRVIRNQIADDPVLTNPQGELYVYRTGVNLMAIARYLDSGGPDNVGAAVGVRAALQNGMTALRAAQGDNGLAWDWNTPGLDLEMSYMAASGLSAASRVLPEADDTLPRLAPALDALQGDDGGFRPRPDESESVGATLTALWLHRLAGTSVGDLRVRRALLWLEARYRYDPVSLGLATEETFWQPWNGTRALFGYRLNAGDVSLGALDPATEGYPEEPRGLWFDHARGLIARQQGNGSWATVPPNGRSVLSMHSLSLLTMSRSLGGAHLAETDLVVPPACNDRRDNDADGRVDLQDADCPRACGSSERPQPVCANARDDDADGLVDFPDDPGCTSPYDGNEANLACDNGQDDDADGRADWPADPGCEHRRDTSEADGAQPQRCANGVDDDGDGRVDFGADPDCLEASQNDERLAPACVGEAPVLIRKGVRIYDGVTAGNDFQGSCGGVRGNDSLFALNADVPMDVVFSTANDETAIDTVLHLRRGCDAAAQEVACADDVAPGDPLSTLAVRLDPGNYFLVVDTKVGGGAFRLTVDATPRPFACVDTVDNDADGRIDLADPGCSNTEDPSESDPAQPAVCNNGRDDDADGRVDFPDDMGCAGLGDTDERDPGPPFPACSNGRDDDADGLTDWPEDPSCLGRGDITEHRPSDAACANLVDDDQDALVDFPADPGCAFAADRDEVDPAAPPACSNGADDDADGRADYPVDPGCAGAGDGDEADPAAAPACANGRDDDADGETDFPRDPGCRAAGDGDETDPFIEPDCLNGEDDDLDGRLDWPDDPGCLSAADTDERDDGPLPPRCADGVDNDDDGRVDLADPGCLNDQDDDEVDPAGGPPVCANGRDDDADGRTDWPNDAQCQGAGDITEGLGCRAGLNVPLVPRNGSVNGATAAGGADRFEATCGGAGAPDAVYRYALPAARTLVVSVDNPGTRFPAVVSVRRDCEEAPAELVCASDAGANGPTVTLNNAAAGDYYVIVDGNPLDRIVSRGEAIAMAADPQGFTPRQDFDAARGWVDGGRDAFDDYGVVELGINGVNVATNVGQPGILSVGGVDVRLTRDFPHPNIMRFRIEPTEDFVDVRADVYVTGDLGSDAATEGAAAEVDFRGVSLGFLRTTDGVPTDPPVTQLLVASDPDDAPFIGYDVATEDDVTISAPDIRLPAVLYVALSYHDEGTVLDAILSDLVGGSGGGPAFGAFELTVREQ